LVLADTVCATHAPGGAGIRIRGSKNQCKEVPNYSNGDYRATSRDDYAIEFRYREKGSAFSFLLLSHDLRTDSISDGRSVDWKDDAKGRVTAKKKDETSPLHHTLPYMVTLHGQAMAN